MRNPYFAETRSGPNCHFRTRVKYFSRNYYFFEIEFSPLSSGCSAKKTQWIRVSQKTPRDLGFFCGTLISQNFTENAGFLRNTLVGFLRNALYKPHEKTVDVCSVRLVRTEGGVLHFLGAQDSAVSAILRNRSCLAPACALSGCLYSPEAFTLRVGMCSYLE